LSWLAGKDEDGCDFGLQIAGEILNSARKSKTPGDKTRTKLQRRAGLNTK
jgi:hypothetical protein